MNDVDRMFDDVMEYVEDESQLVNHVAIILDVSGSMARFGAEPMDNFNNQLLALKEKKGDQKTLLTYVEFGSEINVKFVDRDIELVDRLDEYSAKQPSTRLNDAIGITISEIRNNVEKNYKHSALVIIITDGEENNSQEFRGHEGTKKIQKMIKDLEKTEKWTFTFMGTDDINTEGISSAFAFSMGNVAKFSGARGMSATANYGSETTNSNFTVSDKMTNGISKYYDARRLGKTSIKNFYEEDE